MEREFGIEAMAALLSEVFAPWVQALALSPEALTETGAVFALPVVPDLARGGGGGPGVLCGQAMAAAADTAAVVALASLNGRFRNCTTTGLRIDFLRPVPAGETAQIEVSVLSNGRAMANVRIDIRAGKGGRLAASAAASFFYLEA